MVMFVLYRDTEPGVSGPGEYLLAAEVEAASAEELQAFPLPDWATGGDYWLTRGGDFSTRTRITLDDSGSVMLPLRR